MWGGHKEAASAAGMSLGCPRMEGQCGEGVHSELKVGPWLPRMRPREVKGRVKVTHLVNGGAQAKSRPPEPRTLGL